MIAESSVEWQRQIAAVLQETADQLSGAPLRDSAVSATLTRMSARLADITARILTEQSFRDAREQGH